jgi:hypothetical protein
MYQPTRPANQMTSQEVLRPVMVFALGNTVYTTLFYKTPITRWLEFSVILAKNVTKE